MTGSAAQAPDSLATLDTGSTPRVPTALIEACGLPEIGSRLAPLTVRLAPDLAAPFTLRESSIAVRPDVAGHFASVAVVLREAIELDALQACGGPPVSDAARRVLAHATAVAYAGSVLVRRLRAVAPHESDAPPMADVLAGDLTLEDLVERPRSAAGRIAAFLARRDGTAPTGPADLEAAARALPLACPTEVLLTRGGDDRQVVDWRTGLNGYGIAPSPTPWIASYGSCTASSPTYRAFDAARRFRLDAIDAALDDRLPALVRDRADAVRGTVLAVLGRETGCGARVVLTPSGTDAELVALAVATASGDPVTVVLVAPTEVGRGSAPAAGGRHFSARLPGGDHVTPNDPLAGVDPEQIRVVTVPVRDDDGAVLALDAVRDCVEAHLRAAPGRVLLHVVEGTKTGIRAPHPDHVRDWEARFGDRLDVVVDAAQMRVDTGTVAAHLDAGRMLIVTGSKFYGGPPFSGAVVVPAALTHRLGAGATVPVGLGSYLTRADVPDDLPALAAVARAEPNLGLLARWEAALSEVRSFHNASWQIRDEVLRRLAVGIRATVEAAAHVALVESPYTPIPDDDRRGLTDLPTIFTFLVRGADGRYLDADEARAAQQLLARDLSPLLGHGAHVPPVACRPFHLGQPVRIRDEGGRSVAALRIAVGAATISQVVFDHTRGPTWRDRLDRELGDVRDALDKLALVVHHLGPASESPGTVTVAPTLPGNG